jgi:hypothetical protein
MLRQTYDTAPLDEQQTADLRGEVMDEREKVNIGPFDFSNVVTTEEVLELLTNIHKFSRRLNPKGLETDDEYRKRIINENKGEQNGRM